MKDFADDDLKFDDSGKGRNRSLGAISTFATVVSKILVPQTLKNQGLVWENVKDSTNEK